MKSPSWAAESLSTRPKWKHLPAAVRSLEVGTGMWADTRPAGLANNRWSCRLHFAYGDGPNGSAVWCRRSRRVRTFCWSISWFPLCRTIYSPENWTKSILIWVLKNLHSISKSNWEIPKRNWEFNEAIPFKKFSIQDGKFSMTWKCFTIKAEKYISYFIYSPYQWNTQCEGFFHKRLWPLTRRWIRCRFCRDWCQRLTKLLSSYTACSIWYPVQK